MHITSTWAPVLLEPAATSRPPASLEAEPELQAEMVTNARPMNIGDHRLTELHFFLCISAPFRTTHYSMVLETPQLHPTAFTVLALIPEHRPKCPPSSARVQFPP